MIRIQWYTRAQLKSPSTPTNTRNVAPKNQKNQAYNREAACAAQTTRVLPGIFSAQPMIRLMPSIQANRQEMQRFSLLSEEKWQFLADRFIVWHIEPYGMAKTSCPLPIT